MKHLLQTAEPHSINSLIKFDCHERRVQGVDVHVEYGSALGISTMVNVQQLLRFIGLQDDWIVLREEKDRLKLQSAWRAGSRWMYIDHLIYVVLPYIRNTDNRQAGHKLSVFIEALQDDVAYLNAQRMEDWGI